MWHNSEINPLIQLMFMEHMLRIQPGMCKHVTYDCKCEHHRLLDLIRAEKARLEKSSPGLLLQLAELQPKSTTS